MDLKNVETFVKVAELQSFTKAAEELSYVQSTVTMQIKQLEKELSFPLFDRIGKKISLTAAGREFLEAAYELLRVMKSAESIGKKKTDMREVLRIGVSESLMFTVIEKILPKFKKKFANVDLKIITGHSAELTEQLRRNLLDIVYISQPPFSDTELSCKYIRPERLCFVCSPDYKAVDEKSIKNILGYDFLVTEQDGICNRMLFELASHYGTEPKITVEIDSVYMIIRLAAKGLGVAFLPEYAVKEQLQKGTLKEIVTDAPVQMYSTQILSHKNHWVSPSMTQFIEMVNEHRPAEKSSFVG